MSSCRFRENTLFDWLSALSFFSNSVVSISGSAGGGTSPESFKITFLSSSSSSRSLPPAKPKPPIPISFPQATKFSHQSAALSLVFTALQKLSMLMAIFRPSDSSSGGISCFGTEGTEQTGQRNGLPSSMTMSQSFRLSLTPSSF